MCPCLCVCRSMQWCTITLYPIDVGTVLCFVCFCYGIISFCIVMNNIYPYDSLALVQSSDFSSAIDITLKDVGEINGHQTTKKKHNRGWTMCIILGIYMICFLFLILREKYIDIFKTKLSRTKLCSYFMGYSMYMTLTFLLSVSLDNWHGKP